jgi:hypothetical protein
MKLMNLKVDLDSIYLKFIKVQQSPNPILSLDDYTIKEWRLLLQKSNQRYLYKKQRQVLLLLRAQINKKVFHYQELKKIKAKYGEPLYNLIITFYEENLFDNQFEPGLFTLKRKFTRNEYILFVYHNGDLYDSEENLDEDLRGRREALGVRLFWLFWFFLKGFRGPG